MSDDLQIELFTLEQLLWTTEDRNDPIQMDRLFDSDLIEFGASGQRYSRADLMPDGKSTELINVVLLDFSYRQLGVGVVQTMYISQWANGPRANRSSIWRAHADGWQLVFHQGTPTT